MARARSNLCPPCPALSWKEMCDGVGAASPSQVKKARPDPISNTHNPGYIPGKILPTSLSNLGLPQVGFSALFSHKGQI